jgi:hypothetical protein
MLRGILELMRPANVATALADVLAGFGVAGLHNPRALPWLLGATACLYAGGVVLNDVFDRDVDRVERPERPIPSGRVPVAWAAIIGFALLSAGVLSASRATWDAGVVAAGIAALVLLYDAWSTRYLAVAPINMGLCRAFNLLLGVAAVPGAVVDAWPIALIPFLYICGVTALSRGEVHGGSVRIATFALISLGAALLGLAFISLKSGFRAVPALALALLVAWRVLPPFWNARSHPAPETIRAAVKRGVLSLVLVDASVGAAYAGPVFAVAILTTAIVAGWLARRFAVT